VFGQNQVTVISQGFHNERALYISQRKGLKAIAFNAPDLTLEQGGLMVRSRELLARVRTLADLHILDQQPRFLGEQIPIASLKQQ
jgi:SanA protein